MWILQDRCMSWLSRTSNLSLSLPISLWRISLRLWHDCEMWATPWAGEAWMLADVYHRRDFVCISPLGTLDSLVQSQARTSFIFGSCYRSKSVVLDGSRTAIYLVPRARAYKYNLGDGPGRSSLKRPVVAVCLAYC